MLFDIKSWEVAKLSEDSLRFESCEVAKLSREGLRPSPTLSFEKLQICETFRRGSDKGNGH